MVRPLFSDADLSNRTAMLGKLDNARGNLEAAYQGWDALTAGQKDSALKLSLRVVCGLSRLLANELDTAGP
jgi:hypothetical protein